MLPQLRYRWILLGLAPVILIILAPTPIPKPLVSSVVAAAQALSDDLPEDAASSFEQALIFDPTNASLHMYAAEAYLASNNPDQALVHLSQAEQYAVDEAALELLRGEALRAQGDIQAATLAWEQSHQTRPLPEENLRNLANAYMNLGMEDEARAAFEDLVTLAPNDHDAVIHLVLLIARDEPADALEHLRLAEQLAPGQDPIFEDLIATIEEGLESESVAYQLARIGQTLLRYDEWEFAAFAFRSALSLEPDYTEALAYMGLVLSRIDMDGVPELLRAIEIEPDTMLPHIFLGMVYHERGESDAALNELQTAAEINASNPAIYAMLGAALDSIGEINQAMMAYTQATVLAPNVPDFWLLLAQYTLAREIEISTVALPAARNALALEARNAAGLDALGYGYYLLGNFPMAERLLTHSIRIDPSLALTQYHLGLLRLTQGETDRARAALERAVQIDGNGQVGTLAQLTLENLAP
jgi:tetratricopeptide (TPR) repeat protein